MKCSEVELRREKAPKRLAAVEDVVLVGCSWGVGNSYCTCSWPKPGVD